jgi:hypothetical protein
VILLVPIALGVPAVFVLIPPLVTFTPATLPSLVQFTTLVVCFGAMASMFLDGLVEFMLRVNDPTLTPVLVFGVESWHCREKQTAVSKAPDSKDATWWKMCAYHS